VIIEMYNVECDEKSRDTRIEVALGRQRNSDVHP
jgi:hypothetical protein